MPLCWVGIEPRPSTGWVLPLPLPIPLPLLPRTLVIPLCDIEAIDSFQGLPIFGWNNIHYFTICIRTCVFEVNTFDLGYKSLTISVLQVRVLCPSWKQFWQVITQILLSLLDLAGSFSKESFLFTFLGLPGILHPGGGMTGKRLAIAYRP